VSTVAPPRVLLIAQWPSIKNAEYELAERIRHTGFKVTVVDFLGLDVQSGRSINGADLCEEYDFALSFHYETPKFLNLPTFHWVANPLEFIHAQGNYRTHLLHHLRSYDDFLYNGSQYLKEHIRSLVGAEWRDSGLGFYQSCSRNALLPPRAAGQSGDAARKLFYCGVNWEAISDKESRAQGLLELLQERDAADFYGPQSVLGVNVWASFPSYRGEIPFDGSSMFPAMHEYAAVLALSSPAHIKSRTSSGRVLEGFAAGVPVISDENHHVRALFGDLVYYFEGASERERAESIRERLAQIEARPEEARDRVHEAQKLISEKYCFEVCLEQARDLAATIRGTHPVSLPVRSTGESRDAVIDVFLFHHDPYAAASERGRVRFENLAHIRRAMQTLAPTERVRFRLLHGEPLERESDAALPCELVDLTALTAGSTQWSALRLGEKVARLAERSTGDFAVFLTQSDFPQYDYFAKALAWFSTQGPEAPGLHIGGFYVNDFSAPAPMSAGGILRNSASNGLYRWTQNSIAEHQLAQLCFNRQALRAMTLARLERFDVLLPVAAVLECMGRDAAIQRSRHVLLRVCHGHYHRYYEAFSRVAGKGIWAQHYELLSNATHEINGLYDAFHEQPAAVAIADRILGIDIPPTLSIPPPPTDPAVLAVNHFLNRISPYVQMAKKVGRAFRLRS
jgi:hypothetical protein